MSADLPQGWAQTTLGDLIEPRRIKADPQATPTAEFIGLEHVEAHTTKLLGTTSAAAMKSSASTFKQSDVLYGRLRPYLNKVCQPDFDGLCSGEFVVMPENQAISGAFLKHRLNAQDFVEFASHLNAGDRPRVDFSQLRPFALTLPPKKEQTRIADMLAALFDQLDAGTDTLRRCQEKLARYRASVLKAAVEGDLTASWRKGRKEHPDVEPASKLLQRILAERRQRWEQEQLRTYAEKGKAPPKNWKAKYKEPVAPEPAHLPDIPRHWQWVGLDQIGATQGGLQKSPARTPKRHHFPYLRVANVHRGALHLDELRRFELTPEELRKLRLEPGDVLLVEGNGSREEIGRCALWNGEVEDCVHQNHIIRVRPSEGVLSEYLDIFLNSPMGQLAIQQAASSTSGLYTLSVAKVKGLSVALPPVAEQRAIIKQVAAHVSAVNEVDRSLAEKLSHANGLRQSILHRAFTGNLLPQDSSDEPASKLLERIASEREARQRKSKRHRV